MDGRRREGGRHTHRLKDAEYKTEENEETDRWRNSQTEKVKTEIMGRRQTEGGRETHTDRIQDHRDRQTDKNRLKEDRISWRHKSYRKMLSKLER